MSGNFPNPMLILISCAAILHSYLVIGSDCQCPSCKQLDPVQRCQCCIYRHIGKRSGLDMNTYTGRDHAHGQSRFSAGRHRGNYFDNTRMFPPTNYPSYQIESDNPDREDIQKQEMLDILEGLEGFELRAMLPPSVQGVDGPKMRQNQTAQTLYMPGSMIGQLLGEPRFGQYLDAESGGFSGSVASNRQGEFGKMPQMDSDVIDPARIYTANDEVHTPPRNDLSRLSLLTYLQNLDRA